MTHLFLLLILPEYLIHDNGDSAIACYIAGGAQCREVGWKHIEQLLERILMG